MKFQIKAKTLCAALQRAAGAVPAKPAKPEQESFLLNVSYRGDITVTSDNGFLSYSENLQADEPMQSEAGTVLLPAALLLDTVKALGDETVSFSAQGDGTLEITYANGSMRYPFLDVSAFEKMPWKQEDTTETDFDAKELLDALLTMLPFTDKHAPAHPAFGAVCMDFTDGAVRLAATDSHILAEMHFLEQETAECQRFLLDADAVALMKRSLAGEEGTVHAEFTAGKVRLTLGDRQITARETAGKFPNYKAIMPSDRKWSFTVGREELLRALHTVLTCTSRITSRCRIDLAMALVPELTLSAEDIGFALSAQQKCAITYDSGPESAIGLNGDHLTSLLKAFRTETVRIAFDNPRAPLLVTSPDDARLRALIMPVALPEKNNQ